MVLQIQNCNRLPDEILNLCTICTRLTAFTLKILQNADEADWRITTYIPTELLNTMAAWICKYQNETTGAFWDPAPAYDRKLWVGHYRTIINPYSVKDIVIYDVTCQNQAFVGAVVSEL